MESLPSKPDNPGNGTGNGAGNGIGPRYRESVLLTAVLLGIVLLLLAIMVAATQVMAGVRAYTSGESMWSKGQKDAAYYLMEYAETGDMRDWREYRKNIEIPLGDRRGRLALDDTSLDADTQYRIAYEGFRQGGNHPDDIPMMIFLYRWFSWQPHFAEAIETWRKGDTYILAIAEIAETIRAEHQSGAPDRELLRSLKNDIHDLDYDVHAVEIHFSNVMGDAARWVQSTLMTTMLSASLLLLVFGAWLNRRITAQRFEAETRYRSTFEQAAVGMSQVSLHGDWMVVNNKLCEILGYPREQLLKMNIREVTHPDDVRHSEQVMAEVREHDRDEFTFEKRYICADGRTIWVNVNVRLLRDIRNVPLYFIVVVEDVTEARLLSEKLSHQASHDALTGLINRYEFERRIRQAIRRARVENVGNALCFLDLDQFKIINDTCGHGAGDALLQQLGSQLRSCIRSNDTLARLGGDEFGVLLEACPLESAIRVAEKLRTAVKDFRFHWGKEVFSIGVSIGVVPFDGQNDDLGQLLSAADAACYTAKEAGRNRVHLSETGDPDVGKHMLAMQWQQRLKAALEHERFFLVWQPIRHLAQDKIVPREFEVLLRLRDEDGNVIPPGQFLPSAERFGIIRDIDRWVLVAVLRWLSQAAEQADSVDRISLNISGLTLADESFTAEVTELLDSYRVPAGKLCFEITETATITNLAHARNFMAELQSRGCRFALDDFGMGVSSFAYLNTLPVDYVKIDGTFVRDMAEDDVHAAMVRSINDIAHSMGKKTVAEFVETEEVLGMLLELGVDYAQGYAIGKPITMGNFPEK